jgi:hypothetical protein
MGGKRDRKGRTRKWKEQQEKGRRKLKRRR